MSRFQQINNNNNNIITNSSSSTENSSSNGHSSSNPNWHGIAASGTDRHSAASGLRSRRPCSHRRPSSNNSLCPPSALMAPTGPVAKLLLLISLHACISVAFILPHSAHHNLLSYNTATAAASEEEDKSSALRDEDGQLKLHGTDLLVLHSAQKHIRTLGDCVEVSDRNATLLKSISRSSDSLVDLAVPNEQRFNIHYCANAAPAGGQQECGENSVCGTIYRWKKATIRVDTTAALSAAVGDDLPDIYLQEQVLVPSGCSCLINAANTKFARMPIIIES